MREDSYRRTVVFVRTRDAHQQLGAESRNSGLTVLGQRPDRDIGITTAGQPNSGVKYQPLGGTVSPQLIDLVRVYGYGLFAGISSW